MPAGVLWYTLGTSCALWVQPLPACGRLAITSQAAASDSLRLEDLTSRRELLEVRLSPDGLWVAYVLRQAVMDDDRYVYTLYIGGSRPAAPKKLLESAELPTNVRWSPDGRWVTYVSSEGGSAQLWRMLRTGGKATRVFYHAPGKAHHRVDNYLAPGAPDQEAGVFIYQWSPRGRLIAFTTATGLSPADRKKIESRGIVYDDENMSYQDLITRTWVRHPTELWVYDLRTRRKSLVWKISGDITGLAWSPDERSVAVTHTAPPGLRESRVFFNQDVGVVRVSDGSYSSVSSGEAYEAEPAWSPAGDALAFVSLLGRNTSSISVVAIATGERKELGYGRVASWMTGLQWTADGHHLWFEAPDSGALRRGKSAIYRVEVATDSITEVTDGAGHLSGCSFAAGRAACIWQTAAQSPEPAVVNLKTGKLRVVARLNPSLERKPLGEVTELHWSNRYGDRTNGFLLKPVGYVKGKRYPTLVITYWFEGRFAAEAEWITSYPAQLFSRDGFAVLMMNYPRYTDWPGNNFVLGSRAVGYSPLASIERGIDLLVEEGIADSTRLGILGWSYGGFLGQFALANTRRFKAASIGADGDYNPGAYWLLGRRAFRKNYERVMGGPPYGETLKNWIAFSPAYNAGRVEAPVLMEYSGAEAFLGLEMSSAYRSHGVPVELIIYPDEGHVLTRPLHRYHSMQRNLDWFNFWLQGREDPAPDKAPQYERWRAMRTSLAARLIPPGQPSDGVGEPASLR